MTRRAFTLLELILVLVVLGVVSLMAVPALVRATPVRSGGRLRLLRSLAIKSGQATHATDADAARFPLYATPDGLVIADSAATLATFKGDRTP